MALLAKWGLRETAGENHARLSLPWCQALPDLKTDNFALTCVGCTPMSMKALNGAGCRSGKDPVFKPSLSLVPHMAKAGGFHPQHRMNC